MCAAPFETAAGAHARTASTRIAFASTNARRGEIGTSWSIAGAVLDSGSSPFRGSAPHAAWARHDSRVDERAVTAEEGAISPVPSTAPPKGGKSFGL